MADAIRIDWPEFGSPDLPPALSLAELRDRLAVLRATGSAYDVLVIYGDREHAANLHWLTGFDPRFEEAILVISATTAHLLAGNECLSYTRISPLVQAGDIIPGLCASLSLPSQPREGRRLGDWLADLIPLGAKVGAIGWKWFETGEVDDPATALDLPAFVADPVRARAARVENATALLMHPAHGLRTRVDAAGIARLEFANHMAAKALKRMMFSLREGMRDFEAVEAARIGGLPLGCHPTFATNGREGLSGPTGELLRRGQPIAFNICHWGANICRAGWVAQGPSDLPAAARDYLDVFALPYLQAMSDWCALMVPGTPGGAVWSAMRRALPLDAFNVTLNPGHLIDLDEWVSSPIREASTDVLASGMAMQMDVIPSHPIYGSTRMEDGYALADAALRADLTRQFPDVARRCAARQGFMRDVIGMAVPETLLPLADTCGLIAPWVLDPAQVLTL